MNKELKLKLIIVGGTGLLGYSATSVALERGYDVTSLAINDADAVSWYPNNAKMLEGDVFAMSEDELYDLFNKGKYDALIYAVGPSDRVDNKEDAYKFFHKRLVECCSNVFNAARRAGIKKAVVCSSYFLYFDRKFPKKKLAIRHPYIRARKEQAETLIHIGMDDNSKYPRMDVCIMELPYIFGVCPNRRPIWRYTFLDQFAKGKKILMFPKGGSVVTTSYHVGEALIGAVENGVGGKQYAIGGENHDYNWILDKLLQGIQGKPMKVWNPPRLLASIGAKCFIQIPERHKGVHHGFDYYRLMMDIMSDYFYFPQIEIDDTCKKLGITKGGIEEAIVETGKACYDEGEWQ